VIRYLHRHWRGELPLGVAFWANGVALTAAMAGIEALYTWRGPAWQPETAVHFTAWVLGALAWRGVVPAWQCVGLLRGAATARAHGGRDVTGTVALAGAVALALAALGRLGMLALDVGPATRIAYAFGDYARTVSVVDDGRAIELNGGLSFGAADEVARALATHPGVRRIVLNSGGGSLGEGRKLRALILAHGLDTDTTVQCSSACVSAYIGGRHRYLHGDALMGFHLPRSDEPDINLPEWYAEELAYFAQIGVPPWFIRRWAATGRKFWYPAPLQLRQAGIVETHVG
jgi:hypothetical protein